MSVKEVKDSSRGAQQVTTDEHSCSELFSSGKGETQFRSQAVLAGKVLLTNHD